MRIFSRLLAPVAVPALLLALVAAPPSATLQAREAAPAPAAKAQPWLYENSDVPVDASWTFGVLPNGLRYAVKHNVVPAGQVSIRIRVDAGSLYESDAEQGYAHLLEHLTFRGSTHVPDGEAKRIWQRFGVSFGSDSNALTTPTQTVYKLDLPNANAERLDESMKILAGMIRSPNINAASVAAESQIVQAELREGDGPQRRLGDATRQLFFHGQKLANRSPIGSADMLQKASVEAMRAFHARWYRPDHIVIAMAGDARPADLEKLIRTHFGNWKVPAPKPAQPPFGDPVATGPVAALFVEPTMPTMANIAITRPWRQVEDTIVYNEQLMVDGLALRIVNRRLESRARTGASFLQAQIDQEDISRSADTTMITILPKDNQWQKAIAEVRGVIADALAVPPSRADIERELEEFGNSFRINLDSYPFEGAAAQVDNIVAAVDIRETVASPEVALNVFNAMRDRFTPERVMAATRAQLTGTATRLLLAAPAPVEGGVAAAERAMTDPVAPDSGARLPEITLGADALPALGKPGTMGRRLPLPDWDMEVVELSNGMRAILYPNQAESGKIKVMVRFGRGRQAFSPLEGDPMAWSSRLGVIQAGVGDLDQDRLDQLANGKRLGFSFDLEDDAFEFSADTRPADLLTQLKLFAGKLAHPRWDAAPLERLKNVLANNYATFDMSAGSVLERDLRYLMRRRDPRWKEPSPADLARMTPARFRAVWEPILASGPVEILLFGDFQKEEAEKALLETFGALPPRPAAPLAEGADRIGRPTDGNSPAEGDLVLYHRGQADQAAAVLAWPTDGGPDMLTSRRLEILMAIFQDRLFETFRTEDAASYSPYVISEWPENFADSGFFAAISQVQPANIDLFLDKARQIAADLAARPVSDDELERALSPMRAYVARASSGNYFWMEQLKGGTQNGRRFLNLSTMLTDFRTMTPADLQAVAKQYLLPGKARVIRVLPAQKQAGEGR